MILMAKGMDIKAKTEKIQKNLEEYRKNPAKKEKEAYGGNRPRNVTKEEFERYVKPCGSSGHVGVSKAWVGKYVHVTMEEVKDE